MTPKNKPLFAASRVPPGQIAKLRLKNLSADSIGFKFKTNAPLKYSVKPVLGALAPGESIKIFGILPFPPPCNSLIQELHASVAPLQIAKTDAPGYFSISPNLQFEWKTLDHKRFVEHYIPCSSPSALSLGDPEDDAGTLSSSSVASSHRSRSSSYTPPFSAIDLSRERPRQQQQVFERWQYMEATRPTISIGGVGRRLSSSSSTCSSATSSPGSYPTLFTSSRRSFEYYPQSPSLTATSTTSALSSKRNSVSSTASGSQFLVQQHHLPHNQLQDPAMMPSAITEEPSSLLDHGSSCTDSGGRFLMLMGLSEDHVVRIADHLRVMIHPITKTHMLALSLVCLLIGLLIPL
ncbi:hypothetical protein KVV02_008721 [Mortierella alpina]|uniref:MSP domain-containing protein n=1 Tax=Mortierella alpina TaxID=64518 RepID=A0A9P8ACI9_MORAP|nr:hypothetical protein KVV02_008721 [Mortierella alpina]